MQLSDTCPFCQKPYAYQLPSGSWYEPPLYPMYPYRPSITITTTTNTTNWGELTFSAYAQPNPDPTRYCYGHLFVRCESCHCLVPDGFHSQDACAVLKGLMQGIQQVAAYVEREEQIPASERLPGNVDVPEVPDVFQRAFKEIERL